MAVEDQLTWTPEARVRLEQVPEGMMRELTRQRVETLARRLGQSTVTLELMGAKYQQWSEGSAQSVSQMAWTDEARERMERIPDFVRGKVVEAVEAWARQQGLSEITPTSVDDAKRSWGESGRFHGP